MDDANHDSRIQTTFLFLPLAPGAISVITVWQYYYLFFAVIKMPRDWATTMVRRLWVSCYWLIQQLAVMYRRSDQKHTK